MFSNYIFKILLLSRLNVGFSGSRGITQMVVEDMSDDDDDDDDTQANRQDGDFDRPITFEQRMVRLRQIAQVRWSEAARHGTNSTAKYI